MTPMTLGAAVMGILVILLIFVPILSTAWNKFQSQAGARALATAAAPAAATPSNPKGPLIVKRVVTAIIVLLVYYLPSLMKDSMPGKALLSALGATNAGWYPWVWWLSAGLIAGWILLKIWRKKDAKSGETSSGWILGAAVLAMLIGFTALVTYQFAKNPRPGLVPVPFPTFDQMGVGRSVVTGGFLSTYEVSYPAVPRQFANTGKRWDVCLKVTDRSLPVVPIYDRGPANQPVQTFRFSEKTKRALDRYGLLDASIEMTVEFVLTVPGQNPCEVIMAKMAE